MMVRFGRKVRLVGEKVVGKKVRLVGRKVRLGLEKKVRFGRK